MSASPLLAGSATAEGTARFAARFARYPAGAYHRALGLTASSVGLGTYLGDPAGDREACQSAIVDAVGLGLNVIDAAINYRHQASERDVGAAIRALIGSGGATRDELIVSTKGGFLPMDFEAGAANPRAYVSRTYIESGLVPEAELVQGCQCLSPGYIDDQFERSRRNLGLETIDVYFLHNPEMQLGAVSRPEFLERMGRAFEVLARKVREGRLQWYGVATWDGLRQPSGAADGMLLDELCDVAAAVEGPEHRFRVIQLPVNLAFAEAMTVEHDATRRPGKSVLEVASALGLFTMSSASILQGRLAKGLPERVQMLFPGLKTDAQRALQHTRCAPGVTTALVGMKRAEHVRENLALMASSPAGAEVYHLLYG